MYVSGVIEDSVAYAESGYKKRHKRRGRTMSTHGICRQHTRAILYAWKGRPLLRDALCAECVRPLERTASNLLRGVGPYGSAARVWLAAKHPLEQRRPAAAPAMPAEG
jgi:hypothetical protein